MLESMAKIVQLIEPDTSKYNSWIGGLSFFTFCPKSQKSLFNVHQPCKAKLVYLHFFYCLLITVKSPPSRVRVKNKYVQWHLYSTYWCSWYTDGQLNLYCSSHLSHWTMYIYCFYQINISPPGQLLWPSSW